MPVLLWVLIVAVVIVLGSIIAVHYISKPFPGHYHDECFRCDEESCAGCLLIAAKKGEFPFREETNGKWGPNG